MVFTGDDKKMCGKLISHIRLYLMAFHQHSNALCTYPHSGIFTDLPRRDDV